MTEGLCASERRMSILEYLVIKKQSTRKELAVKFSVSLNTISRDIEYLSRCAPIYTKSGNNGGVYIMPGYKLYCKRFTETEKCCLYRAVEKAEFSDKQILLGIIYKFSI